MSQSARHARIGLFVLTGFFLILASAIYVGSVRLLAKEATVLFYFGESVNGLTKGSPVKFKGVTIGEVSDIQVSYGQHDSAEVAYIPVFARINLDRLHKDLGVNPAIDFGNIEVFDEEIAKGLRAKLEMISFITGQLYVELDYFARPEDFKSIRPIQSEVIYKEIPTVPSTMTEFGSSASSIMAKLASLDIKGLNDALREALKTLNDKLSAMETEKWNVAILDVTENLKGATQELDFKGTLTALEETSASLKSLVAKLDGAVDPALEEYQGVMTSARNTLQRIDQAFARLDKVVADNAEVGNDLDMTFLEVREAARALRELLEYLERNPSSIITGRETQ